MESQQEEREPQRHYPCTTWLSSDVWSECLSNLPPEELKAASEALFHNNDTNKNYQEDDDKAERASWLAIKHMVAIAQRYWDTIESDAASLLYDEPSSEEEVEETITSLLLISGDDKFLHLQKLVSEDTSIVGNIFRAILPPPSPSTTTTTTTTITTLSTQLYRKDNTQPVRFRDESWLNIYRFLYRVLRIVGTTEITKTLPFDGKTHHPCNLTIALATGIILGTPKFPAALMTPIVRHHLEWVACACSQVVQHKSSIELGPREDGSSSRDDADSSSSSISENERTAATKGLHNYSGFDANECISNVRCTLVSVRLADEGLWQQGSEILGERISVGGVDKKGIRSVPSTGSISSSDTTTSLLSIDSRIHASTFLIDRLYSQTYVQPSKKDTEDLATAVRLGREAVKLAGQQYESSSKASAQNPGISIEDTSNPNHAVATTSAYSSSVPPAPMQSLFANDLQRCIHAHLALGKALALLAQHVGLQVSDTYTLKNDHDVVPIHQECLSTKTFARTPPLITHDAPPGMIAEDKMLWDLHPPINWCRLLYWTDSFFEESRTELLAGHALCQQLSSKAEQIPLLGAIASADGERLFCMASAAYSIQYRQHALGVAVVKSIKTFAPAFEILTNSVLDALDPLEHSTVDDGNDEGGLDVRDALNVLMRCGKDLGKTCGFVRHAVGRNYRELVDVSTTKLATNLDMVFSLVYLLSIASFGSFHPTTENIARLADSGRRQEGGAANNSVSQTYSSVAIWLREHQRAQRER